jgi:tRNA G10  N-methylase Trm11
MASPPRDKPTAFRPLVNRKHVKRALVNVGGAVETAGNPELADRLSQALLVRPGERDATLTHPFHAYPARLHPVVARALLDALSFPGSTILDPFCGSGTVLVEAMAGGRRVIGRDLSPFAIELAALKTRITSRDERASIVSATRDVVARAERRLNARERLTYPDGEQAWFASHTLREISALVHEISRERGLVEHALRMLLSSVLVKVSLQASDSDTRLVDKVVQPWEAIRLFAYKARELDGCLAALAQTCPRSSTVDVAVDDASQLTTVGNGVVDAIVTSPPYANTYNYLDHHARRYAWLGINDDAMAVREMGAARWFEVPEAGVLRFKRELGAMCQAFARVLAPAGRAAVVIADGAAGTEAVRAEKLLREAAEGAGLSVMARCSQERKTFDFHSVRAFSKFPKREHVVVLGREKRS